MTTNQDISFGDPLDGLIANHDDWKLTIQKPNSSSRLFYQITHDNRQRQTIQYLDRYSTYQHCPGSEDDEWDCDVCYGNLLPDYTNEIQNYALYLPGPVVYGFIWTERKLTYNRTESVHGSFVINSFFFKGIPGPILPNGICFRLPHGTDPFRQMNHIWDSVFNNHLSLSYKSSRWWHQLITHAAENDIKLYRGDGHQVFAYWESLDRDQVLSLASNIATNQEKD